jgi:hypothetical protein
VRRRDLLVWVAAAVTVLAACRDVKPTVTASVSPCFRVLPEAHAALGGQGKFVDVARIRGEAVSQFPRLPTTTTDTLPPETGGPTTLSPGRRDVCLVAYAGPFTPDRVEHVIRQDGSRYAIVVVGVTSRKVRGVVLTDTLPKPLHAH